MEKRLLVAEIKVAVEVLKVGVVFLAREGLTKQRLQRERGGDLSILGGKGVLERCNALLSSSSQLTHGNANSECRCKAG